MPLYLDHNATTPVDQQVLEAMLPYFADRFGNASSSTHVQGWEAAAAVDRAREQLGRLLHADPVELTFTSGATEAINLAVKGVAQRYRSKGNHIICCSTEHNAVLDTCRALEQEGLSVTRLSVQSNGRPDPDALKEAIREDTLLVCLMWANNVTGVIAPIEEISEIVRSRGVLFMTDATQAVGKIQVDVAPVDLLALSAHKFYGPKGVGALYVRRRNPRVSLAPLIHGGGQERGRRGGTLNTPGIVGLGAAADRAGQLLQSEYDRQAALRDRFDTRLRESVPGVHINGDPNNRLPGTTSLRIDGVKAGDLVANARSLSFSSSSACSSASGKPSHVLTAMGLSATEAHASIRIGLGRGTTGEEVDFACSELKSAIEKLRAH